MSESPESQRVCLLGSWICPINLQDAVQRIASAARNNEGGYVCLANAHTVSLGRTHAQLRRATNSSILALADGQPVTWMARLLGVRRPYQVRGADLLRATCAYASKEPVGHYFYGGAPEVTRRLVEVLTTRYPGLTVSGYDSPPFRPISLEEDAEAIARIRRSGARILWVGLGAPKQEIWMLEHSPLLPETAMIGVGAAFDFVAGSLREAPPWVRATGLEWFHRLINDPRRLWRRYLISNVTFIVFAFIQLLGGWLRQYGDYKGHRD